MSLTGLLSGYFTDIDVIDSIAINGNVGTANQVLTSDGTNTDWADVPPPSAADILTAGTGIDITATGNPETISTNVKSLVLDGTAVSGAPQTFNPNAVALGGGGSQTITINDTDTTYTATQPIAITGGNDIQLQYDNDTIILDGGDIAVAKVPTTLTFTGYDTGTFDGSSALSINLVDTDTTYTAGNGIQISGSNQIQTKTDNTTIRDSGGGSGNNLEVIKVPNALTAGTNITFSSGTTYDGSAAITISSTDTDTTYSAGTNLNLSGTTFNLNASLTSIDSITMTSTPSASGTSLTGNNYPAAGYQTPMTYFNLLDSTNIVSPYFLHDVYDPSTADADSLSTSYAAVFSSNLKNSFTAQSTSCCIELLIYNYSISGNRWMYLQLGDNKLVEWSSGATSDGGGTGTGTRSTARTIHYSDETDKQPVRQTWYLQGLTVGTSYTINPMARTSSTLNYIYAGGSYPAAILRGYYLPTTSGDDY